MHFKKRTREIEHVILKIRDGDLKARMNIVSKDEFGLAMNNFNEMADQVEYLVNRLRSTESTRRELLNELAHDIKTPIASLKNFLEILRESKQGLTESDISKIFSLSLNEIDFVNELLDDLLLIGRIEEPDYIKHNEKINVVEILENVISQTKNNYSEIEISLNTSGRNIFLEADMMLVKRYVRNILENALSFAAKNISIEVGQDNFNIFIKIHDDGPGFSDEHISNFGNKKFSRVEGFDSKNQRISTGLGAVIAKKVVETYKGKLIVSNIVNEKGDTLGGSVEAKFPII